MADKDKMAKYRTEIQQVSSFNLCLFVSFCLSLFAQYSFLVQADLSTLTLYTASYT